MKIAAVLVILSVYYIASTEQRASGPAGVYKTLEEMERDAQQGMKDFQMNYAGKAFSQNAEAQLDVPTNPQELHECANKDCSGEESCLVMYGRDMLVCNYVCVCVCLLVVA